MAPSQAPSAALLRALRSLTTGPVSRRSLSSSRASGLAQEVQSSTPSPSSSDPTTTSTSAESLLFQSGPPSTESRRRRVARANTTSIPFDELPYQCFQEARKILVADRAEKLKQIETERARIARLQDVDPGTFPGGDAYKQRRLKSMNAELEKLKILADINDPNVKRRFEDGFGKSALC